jgi:hypothetical protein
MSSRKHLSKRRLKSIRSWLKSRGVKAVRVQADPTANLKQTVRLSKVGWVPLTSEHFKFQTPTGPETRKHLDSTTNTPSKTTSGWPSISSKNRATTLGLPARHVGPSRAFSLVLGLILGIVLGICGTLVYLRDLPACVSNEGYLCQMPADAY